MYYIIFIWLSICDRLSENLQLHKTDFKKKIFSIIYSGYLKFQVSCFEVIALYSRVSKKMTTLPLWIAGPIKPWNNFKFVFFFLNMHACAKNGGVSKMVTQSHMIDLLLWCLLSKLIWKSNLYLSWWAVTINEIGTIMIETVYCTKLRKYVWEHVL